MSHYGLPPLPLQVPGILSTLQSRCNLLMRIVHFACISSLRSSCPAVARVRLSLFRNCREEAFSETQVMKIAGALRSPGCSGPSLLASLVRDYLSGCDLGWVRHHRGQVLCHELSSPPVRLLLGVLV